MNLIIHEGVNAQTTEECVELLNQYKQGKWKRVTKFLLTKGKDYFNPERTARVFSNGEETATVISVAGDGKFKMTIVCKNLNLSEHRPLIKEIQKQAEKHYTHDYGEIFFNPYTMVLHIVGGDGGIFYSEKTKEEVGRMFMEGGEEMYDSDGDVNFNLPTINHIELADEYYPEIYELYGEEEFSVDDCFIEIGRMNDVCSLEDFDYFDNYDNKPPRPNSPQPNYPQRQKTIPELERELNAAIQREDFETCAKIRDEINKLKGE